jgi:hypothetical protein
MKTNHTVIETDIVDNEGTYSPGVYAAYWGCDPQYDTPPRLPGDGYLLYNLSANFPKDKAWYQKCFGAIERTIEQEKIRWKPEEKEKMENNIDGLSQLRAYVQKMINNIS